MRLAALLITLALTASACHEAPTSPYSRPAGPPPSGLAATLRILPSTGAPLASPTVVAQGDSLVASAEFDVTGCLDYTSSAGFDGAMLVVTIIESTPPTPRLCTMDKKTAVFRTVVRPAPRGVYQVALRERLEYLSDGPRERELVRATASVP